MLGLVWFILGGWPNHLLLLSSGLWLLDDAGEQKPSFWIRRQNCLERRYTHDDFIRLLTRHDTRLFGVFWTTDLHAPFTMSRPSIPFVTTCLWLLFHSFAFLPSLFLPFASFASHFSMASTQQQFLISFTTSPDCFFSRFQPSPSEKQPKPKPKLPRHVFRPGILL